MDDIFYRCRHPYTEALEHSIPQLSEVRPERLVAIAGNPPNPLHLPPGCAFAPRCPYRLEVCDKSVPPLGAVGGRVTARRAFTKGYSDTHGGEPA